MTDDYQVNTRYCVAVDGHMIDMATISTSELVVELATRDGVDIDTIKPKWDYFIDKTPPEREDDPNDYDYDSECDDDNPGWWRSLCGEGPCKILVVRE